MKRLETRVISTFGIVSKENKLLDIDEIKIYRLYVMMMLHANAIVSIRK